MKTAEILENHVIGKPPHGSMETAMQEYAGKFAEWAAGKWAFHYGHNLWYTMEYGSGAKTTEELLTEFENS
jgi:hypothetical protein